jgi:collagenase-like PrtC family protease
MYEKEYAWSCDAAKELGWLPQTIFSQWALETGWFKSFNYVHNNNIAGQTWYQACKFPKGSARQEGGYYIKYDDPVVGYVSFVRANARRYAKVKEGKTVAEQVKALKEAGWATDPDYVNKVMNVYRTCLDKGYFTKPVVKVVKPVEKPVSLVDYLKSKKMKSDFLSRRQLAAKYKVVPHSEYYSGTAEQNEKLLQALIRAGI